MAARRAVAAVVYDGAMPVPELKGVRSEGWLYASGLGAGLGIAAVDAWARGGPINPVVIVALLLASSGAIGAVWGWRGWPGTLAAAAPMPLMHMAKHLLGLPDTIQPNTLDAIGMMALFALAVAGAGLAGGALLGEVVASESGD